MNEFDFTTEVFDELNKELKELKGKIVTGEKNTDRWQGIAIGAAKIGMSNLKRAEAAEARVKELEEKVGVLSNNDSSYGEVIDDYRHKSLARALLIKQLKEKAKKLVCYYINLRNGTDQLTVEMDEAIEIPTDCDKIVALHDAEILNKLDIEVLSEAVHKAYCVDYLKRKGKSYWTGGDYYKLDEETKEIDRATVRAVIEASRSNIG